MESRVTSDDITAGIGKFAFRALLGFGIVSAIGQHWVIAVPTLFVALVVLAVVTGVRESLREHGGVLTLLFAAGYGCLFYGLWLYVVAGDKFASDKWHLILPVCAIAGVIAAYKDQKEKWREQTAIEEWRKRQEVDGAP